jgi:hypothetical protein
LSSLVVALGAILAGAGTAAGEVAQGTGTVVGRVVDLEGRPVVGAAVWAGDRDQVEAQVRTDADGRFRLGPLSEERAATIWAEDEAKGLARQYFDDVRVVAGRETDLGAVVLAPGARVLGRAVDRDGRPVVGVEATITSRHHVLGHTVTLNGMKWTVRGDEQGQIRTPALSVGDTELIIRAPGKARQYLSRLIEPGQSVIDLGDVKLEDEKPITGLVVDQDGQPIAGARISVDADYDHPAITGADGRFIVHDAATDASWYRIDAAGYFDPTLKPFRKLEGHRIALRIALQKAYTIEGSVIDVDTGAPVEFEQVQLCTVVRDEDAHVTLVG